MGHCSVAQQPSAGTCAITAGTRAITAGTRAIAAGTRAIAAGMVSRLGQAVCTGSAPAHPGAGQLKSTCFGSAEVHGNLSSVLRVPGQYPIAGNTSSLGIDLVLSPEHFQYPKVEFCVWCSGSKVYSADHLLYIELFHLESGTS